MMSTIIKNDKSVIVLGSGAYRIGSSVEFDWCSRQRGTDRTQVGLQVHHDQL